MQQLLNILLVEDDAIEIMKFNRVMKNLPEGHTIVEVNNGEEALFALRDREINPDIIILDLNMPRLNGLEFLSIIKKDPKLKFIPSIILTTSDNHKDVMECYQNGVAGYIVKPLKHDDYNDRIKKLIAYWSTNHLLHH